MSHQIHTLHAQLRQALRERAPDIVDAIEWLELSTHRLIDLDEAGLAIRNAENVLCAHDVDPNDLQLWNEWCAMGLDLDAIEDRRLDALDELDAMGDDR